VAGIPGASVEHNKFCVSVHFRNCEAEQYGAVLGAVEATLRSRAELHASRGRKVFEIKPQARGPEEQHERAPRAPRVVAVWRSGAGGLLRREHHGCAAVLGSRLFGCRAAAGE